MLFQQSPEFLVLRSDGDLCVVHTAMVILTMTPDNHPFGSGQPHRTSGQ